MLIGLDALEKTDWSKLHHAYGRATDTPDHLRALLGDDVESRKKAMSHLWSAIIHQGTPWTATGPAALVIAGMLSDTRIDRGESLRPHLLAFLVGVAQASELGGSNLEELERLAAFDIAPFLESDDDEGLYGNEDAANSFYARSILGCVSVTPVLMKVMRDGLSNGSPRVRSRAAMGAVTLAKTDALRTSVDDLDLRLWTLAQEAKDSDERSAHVLALGELGVSPVPFLTDPSPSVRMCAALAPSLANNATAIDELRKTLEFNAGDIDNWFVERPPQFVMRPRFTLVSRLIQQAKSFRTSTFPVGKDRAFRSERRWPGGSRLGCRSLGPCT